MASPPPSAAAGAAPESPPPAQVVGNAFVQQYYNILHQSPELVYRFYQETSRLGRPASAGADMDTVTTMEAINDKIMSMDITRAEIREVDAQESLCGGVTVLVMGHLTGRNNVSREFVQSFFLAPQEKGYFVLNDILRYIGEGEEVEAEQAPPPLQKPALDVDADAAAEAVPAAALPNGIVEGATESVPREQDALPQPEQHVAEPAPHPQEEVDLNEEVYNPPPNDTEEPVLEETPAPEVINEVPNNPAVPTPSSAPTVPLEEAPKKSYASIVKVMKEFRPPASTVPSRPAPPKPEKQAPPAPALVADVPAFSLNSQSSSFQDPEVDGHAIYVRNLPLNAMPQQLEDEFKRFGTIKHDGIQVRSNKIQGFCFGFVEFEDASVVQSAIEASPVMIGDRQCYVEEKRTTGSRGSSRGRFAPGRGGNFRGEGMRGRGNYSGGRGYGRGEVSYRFYYGGRGGGRGGASRGGDVSYQRVDHSGTAGGSGVRAPSTTTAVGK
ncbi:nuclear transport factor 2-like [Phragmites australis]|uniref:nuclear transport factor 2-like n=1 Tax=Phragmites australis TaxID=29695 RepID=UPI002D79D813|nr:nuclear transport factor 2-like [Phragmites australis]